MKFINIYCRYIITNANAFKRLDSFFKNIQERHDVHGLNYHVCMQLNKDDLAKIQ